MNIRQLFLTRHVYAILNYQSFLPESLTGGSELSNESQPVSDSSNEIETGSERAQDG